MLYVERGNAMTTQGKAWLASLAREYGDVAMRLESVDRKREWATKSAHFARQALRIAHPCIKCLDVAAAPSQNMARAIAL